MGHGGCCTGLYSYQHFLFFYLSRPPLPMRFSFLSNTQTIDLRHAFHHVDCVDVVVVWRQCAFDVSWCVLCCWSCAAVAVNVAVAVAVAVAVVACHSCLFFFFSVAPHPPTTHPQPPPPPAQVPTLVFPKPRTNCRARPIKSPVKSRNKSGSCTPSFPW